MEDKVNNCRKLSFFVTNIVLLSIIVGFFIISTSNINLKVVSVGTDNYSAIYNGNKEKNNISLMVNVYWGNEYLEPMLDIMDKYNVKCTFFVGGSWVSKNVDLLHKIYGKGHEIGSHGYNHCDHEKLTLEQNKEEIEITHSLVKVLLGVDMNLFAPPSGSYSENTLKVCKSMNYKTIMWSKDTIDWRDKNKNLIFQRATKNASNGDLILMHPTENTMLALEDIIVTLQNKNFNLCTVSENLK